MIVFCENDDRVIHGQTMVTWLAEYIPATALLLSMTSWPGSGVAEIYKTLFLRA